MHVAAGPCTTDITTTATEPLACDIQPAAHTAPESQHAAADEVSADEIELFVRVSGMPTLQCMLRSSATVADLKLCVVQSMATVDQAFALGSLRLSFGGMQLHDNQSLESYGLQTCHHITALLRLCGGNPTIPDTTEPQGM